jgi:hypothetical protein
MKHIVPSLQIIEEHILMIRGHRVMLDSHLAGLYGVTTAALNQAVSRNKDRFPEDFSFHVTDSEFQNLISQSVISNAGRGGRRKLPRVFTQEGVAMLSGVLHSKRAVQVNIGIMRAFVKMREAMIAHKDLSRRLNDMERKYDKQFRAVFDALRELMEPPPAPSRKSIGFVRE